jgi:hypothetical protein
LKDIWAQGQKAAEAEQREYTAKDYYAAVDGLTYEEIVKYTDPTGDTAKERYNAAALSVHAHPGATYYDTRDMRNLGSTATTTTDSNGHPTSN